MTDREAEQLLQLLALYVTDYPESGSSAMSVEDVAEDLAQSMDETSFEADRCYRVIAGAF